MSTIVDVSSKLGEYMLKGWVLTDDICAKCHKVPLMRSSTAPATHFCANCDSAAPASGLPPAPSGTLKERRHEHSPSSASSSHPSRSSTPPTELSSTPGSPILVPPMNAEELLRRRQQSDAASAEIGKRMLKGWAMLADECPNSNCYGIPLVRPPKPGGGKGSRKECVVCGTVYVDEESPSGETRLVPLNSTSSVAAEVPSPAAASVVPPSSAFSLDKGKGKGKAVDRQPFPHSPPPGLDNSRNGTGYRPRSPFDTAVRPVYSSNPPNQPQPVNDSAQSSTDFVLDASARSLEVSLHVMSNRLKALSSGPFPDPAMIAQTAEAIMKVSQALMQVKQLQWSESQALGA
ncbi:uncharacterized protein LAESUDRAFT_719006 [Laetiporus sulphureus 93-53]|uniref:Uncharacterized protein n=1 Tax=Laetiporus sulphureus 93-53 TaxID=1314785 RepID=A0A165I888_9APHY|nr:uncharacterized protein LAESUDRAFT_719006 [Laetiporus sulphureus 93-53]KZT12716.1 hypothetical protein LAESUDRAFT_719006 [Laetiporus sulphureus 93-53]